MRNKASLVLMEQLIMLLVFALAASACLGIFSAARNISLSAERQDTAVLLAQTGAETLKRCGGDFSAAAEELNGTAAGKTALIPGDGGYLLHLRETDSGISGLGTAALWVTHESDPSEILFVLETAWQEVD